MSVRSYAAPPTPWSKSLAEPQVDETAYVHSFSNLIGDVHIGANVLIAPGTSIRADEGFPFRIGDNTNIQDGVVIHGLEKGRVKGDDGKEYSVWIGENASITHMALVHGPAYVGDGCFIGFRSTVFNAKVGAGSIVGMHALVQDVEIAPGRHVPAGAVITTQQQADRLPVASEKDIHFATHVVGINDALRTGYHCIEDDACIATFREQLDETYKSSENQPKIGNMQSSLDVTSQVRQLIAQGFSISTEHADERRFRTKSWYSDAPLPSHNEAQLMSALQARLSEHTGEYVRLVGVDPKLKRRVLELVVQRPGDKPASFSASSSASYTSAPASAPSTYSNGNGNGDIATYVRQILNQGHRIGIEHADERRFRTNSWYSGAPINATNEAQALNAIQASLAEYAGEYVRLIGIDTKSKRRTLETIIQRPNGKAPVQSSSSQATSAYRPAANGGNGGSLNGDVATYVRQILNQGHRIGIEHADERRFRTNSWYSGAPINATNEAQALNAIQASLAEYAGEYVRLIGIDTKSKRRVLEAIIQRPNGKGVAAQPKATSGYSAPAASYSSAGNGQVSSSKLSADVLQQIRSLIAQGHRIGTEHADQRRFRINSWNSCSPIESRNEAQVVSALEACLNEHSGEYVRLLGIDSKAKKRVLETIIQRP